VLRSDYRRVIEGLATKTKDTAVFDDAPKLALRNREGRAYSKAGFPEVSTKTHCLARAAVCMCVAIAVAINMIRSVVVA
jgi:hypothetical protein